MEPAAPDRTLGGRYRLLRPIAQGGMATVWLGEDTLLSRRIAIKTLHQALAAEPTVRTRFRNEAISSASIEDPGIVAIYDAGDDDGVVYIVMEYVEGRDLRRLLDERGTLPVGAASHIAERVALALDQAHGHGIVHRDVKPANVLVADDGRVKVTDFGIAKAASLRDDLTSTGTVLGTARYLAPEQVRGDATDARVDVYATGLLLYEMLTGRLPFRGDTDMATALARLTVPPAPLPASVPRGVAAIVERCLADDPARRFPTAGALASALASAADGDLTTPNEVTSTLAAPPRPAAPPAAAPAAPRPRRRRGRAVAWALLLALVLSGAGVAAYLWARAPGNPAGGTSPPRIASATDFDPLGDGHENHQLVNNAIDNNPQTAWSTEIYATRNFGNAKAGVGIYVTLVVPATVHEVTVDTYESQWNGTIYTSANPAPATLGAWGRPRVSRANLGTQAVFAVPAGPSARAVLVWITNLPPGGRLDISEIHLR
jgi:tRNA A-37 threonylcarbamoyl transferase component Bud32